MSRPRAWQVSFRDWDALEIEEELGPWPAPRSSRRPGEWWQHDPFEATFSAMGLGQPLSEYVDSHPNAQRLLQTARAKNLSEEDLYILCVKAEMMSAKPAPPAPSTPTSQRAARRAKSQPKGKGK